MAAATDRRPTVLDFVRNEAGVWSDPQARPKPPPFYYCDIAILRPQSIVSLVSAV